MENAATGPSVGTNAADGPRTSILVVDDDAGFFRGLQSAFLKHGFVTEHCTSISRAVDACNMRCFQALITELVVGGESGIQLVKTAASSMNAPPIVVLTAYGNISAAVTSIKLGARDFLIKPTEATDILHGLGFVGFAELDAERRFKSPHLVRWDHVFTIYEDTGRNISATARRLNMHRRTLQRMLARGEPEGPIRQP